MRRQREIVISKYYPQILVALQFGIIGLMIISSDGILSAGYPLIVFALGVIIGIWALSHNKLGNFHIQPIIREGSELITTGIYRYIRHPMYLSVITMMSAILLSTPTPWESILLISLVTVLTLKAKREESLWLDHNEEYDDYIRNSKLFIPFVL